MVSLADTARESMVHCAFLHIDAVASIVLAQSASSDLPLWRGVLALLLAIAALAVTIAASGYAQRWLLDQVSRRQLTAPIIFAIATAGGALLWMAAKSLRMVETPAGGYSGFRPFTQGLAKCGVIMIGVTTIAMLLITWRDRAARFGIIDAQRAIVRLGLPGLITFIVGLLLLEPLLVNTDNPRPTNDDITMRSPLGLIIGAVVIMLIAAAGAWYGGASKVTGDEPPEPDRRTIAERWMFAGILLPVCFVLFRVAVRLDPLAAPASRWLGELGGSSDQGLLSLLFRWCIIYSITVITCQQAAMRGLKLAVASTQPQEPIAWKMPTTDELVELLPWKKARGKSPTKRSASSSSLTRTEPRTSLTTSSAPQSAHPLPPPKSTAQPQESEVRLPLAPPGVPRHSPLPVPEAKRDIATDGALPKVVPLPAIPAPPALPTDAKSEEWTPLPIDPRTGLIRQDVADRIQRELEQDGDLVAQPHRRRSRRTEHLQDHAAPAPLSMPAPIDPPRPVAAQSVKQSHSFERSADRLDEGSASAESMNAESNSPALMPHTIVIRCRWVMLFAVLAYAGLSYYASMVPLNYQPMAWDQAVERFRNIAKFDVHDNANRRADFVANIALFVPIGFLGMGALVFARRSVVLHAISVALVGGLSVALAYGIEFRQLWYPPRTVSQNDLIAEQVGAAIGIVAWLLVGRGLVNKTAQLFSAAGTAIARLRLLQLYAISLVIFCLLPMDFTLSLTKVMSKLHTVRFGGSVFTGDLLALGRILRDVIIFIPLGMLVLFYRNRPHHAEDRPKNLQHLRLAALFLLVVSASIEGLKLFMVNGVVDLINIPTRTLGGVIGAAIAAAAFHRDGSLRLTMDWPRAVRIALAVPLVAIHAFIVLTILAPPWRLTFDGNVFSQQVVHFKTGLFVNYYYAGEWTALTNLTHYVLLFVPLGIVLRWAVHRGLEQSRQAYESDLPTSRWGTGFIALTIPLLAGLLLGGAIELMQAGNARKLPDHSPNQVEPRTATINQQASQATSRPQTKGQNIDAGPMPDSTDLLAYTLGTITGWLLIGQFLPVARRK